MKGTMEDSFSKCYKEFITENYWIWSHYFRNLYITGLFVLTKIFEFPETGSCNEAFLVSVYWKMKNKEIQMKISKQLWGNQVSGGWGGELLPVWVYGMINTC